jgi:two-component system, NarL family, sensor histidine kinase UhpB
MRASRQKDLDALAAEASDAVTQSAARLRAVMEALNDAYGADLTADELSTAHAALDRIDGALRSLHGAARLIETADETIAGSPNGNAGQQLAPMHRATARGPIAVLEAREQERARLAEELHDGVAQTLAATIFQTDLLANSLKRDPTAAEQELSRLRHALQRELETMRAYISQLRPPLAEPEGLEEALRESAESLTEYTSIPVELRLDAAGSSLDASGRSVALRVAQEALRNIGKHSGAQRAWLVTRYEPRPSGDVWVLEVGDDGKGFDLDAPRARGQRRHFGLRFMRERAELLGAQLFIETRPAAGTVVRLIIALTASRARGA